MTDKRLKFILFNKEERQLWNNLDVNVDSFCDKWDHYTDDFFSRLSLLTNEDLIFLCNQYDIKFNQIREIPNKLHENKKIALELFCLMEFALSNPKAISDFYNISQIKNRIDKSKVIIQIFKEFKSGDIKNVHIALLKHRYGKGFFTYDFVDKIKDEDYNILLNIMPYLTVYLKKKDNYSKFYKFRSAFKDDSKWIFLILRESSDRLYPAIPNNTRLLRGVYKLITVYPQENRLEINTKSRWEAYRIKGYISKKLKNPLAYKRKEIEYNPKLLFQKLIQPSESTIKLIDVKFKKSNLNLKLAISDIHGKNDIISQLKILKNDKKLLKLDDFSEFYSLIFLLNDGLRITIKVDEDKWGRNRLNLIDRRITKQDLKEFKTEFETRFGVELNKYLRSTNTKVDKKKIVDLILNNKTIPINLPKDAEEIFLNLIEKKIINKPKKAAKRRCEKCKRVTWTKGDCPECGNNLYIEGNFIDITKNKKGIVDYVFRTISTNTNLSIKRNKIQIDNTSYKIIDVMNKQDEIITIFPTMSAVPEKIVSHYSETGLPLLIILTQFKRALQDDIEKAGFECIDLTEWYINENDAFWLSRELNNFIVSQKRKWLEKIVNKGRMSFKSLLEKDKNYSDQYFERDIFNLLHEIFYVGDRLGGKFAGVPAPDGIVSIQNYGKPIKRGCLAWDCKYSEQKSGYLLKDNPDKHKRYIHSLKKDTKVKFFGSLLTYAIISNNMNKDGYTKFYFKFTERFRWKGNILFIDEDNIKNIYKIFKDNQEKITNKPVIFYSSIYKLLFKIWKKDSDPFPHISKERLNKFVEEIGTKYNKEKIKLKFDRKDFN